MIVKGEGDKNAKIWVIGEAPGATEEMQGRPFCGGSGTILDSMLKKAGLSRSQCYVDNVIQSRPAKNDFGIYYADKGRRNPKAELLNAHARIRKELSQYQPNLVVALGNEPLYALTGQKGILKWRGSVLECQGVKVIPTIHPAMIMREPKFDPIVAMDFDRIAQEASTPSMPQRYSDRFVINPTFEQIMHFLTIDLPRKDIVAFDIETRPDMEQITCLGFAWAVDEAFCIPIFYGQNSWWTVDEEFLIIRAIRNAFTLKGIKWVAQNAQYDLTYLADKWGVQVDLWMDTMIAFHTVYSERKSLAFLTSIYTY